VRFKYVNDCSFTFITTIRTS